LTEGAKAELRLKDKGIFELSATLEKSRERAFYKQRDEMLNVSELPVYTPSQNNPDPRVDVSTSGSVPPPPRPDELPPAYDV